MLYFFNYNIKEILGKYKTSISKKILTLLHYTVLSFLSKEKKTNLTNIAEYINSSLSSATQLTERMYQAGLIYREHDEDDRRKVNFHITKMGFKKLKSTEKMRREKTKNILSLISEDDLRELNRIQEKILNKLRESEK